MQEKEISAREKYRLETTQRTSIALAKETTKQEERKAETAKHIAEQEKEKTAQLQHEATIAQLQHEATIVQLKLQLYIEMSKNDHGASLDVLNAFQQSNKIVTRNDTYSYNETITDWQC